MNPSGRSTSATAAHNFDLDHQRTRSDGIDVALVELTKPAARRTVGAPDRLNLVALEEPAQRATMLGDDPRQRHGQVVAQRQIRFTRRLVLAAAKHFENQLRALVAVLAGERLDVLERGCFERLEAIAPIHVLDDADHVAAAAHVAGQEIAHAARGGRIWSGHYRRFAKFEPDT